MAYKIIKCGEGKVVKTEVSSSKLFIIDFGLVSSCCTFTILIDKTKLYAFHMVINKSEEDQKSYSDLMNLIVDIVKTKTKSCEVSVGGALNSWKSDLSGPITKTSNTSTPESESEAALVKNLKIKLPKADSIETCIYGDCNLYSCVLIEDNELTIQYFDKAKLALWAKHPNYAPKAASQISGAVTGKQ